MLPVSREVWRGSHRVEDLARIYTMVGEYDKAIPLLSEFFSGPSYWSSAALRLDPTYDLLRENPRFQALLEKYK